MEKKIFVAGIGILLVSVCIMSCLGMGNTKPLLGVYTTYECPDFTLESFYSGEFQKNMENYLNANYTGHHTAVRTYNQFRYSLFQESGNLVVGKDHYLYEEAYINEAYGLEGAKRLTDDEVQMIGQAIYDVQQEARAQGKAFVFVFSPSKADFYAHQIPERYSYRRESDETYKRNYIALMEVFDQLGVNYIDGVELLKENDSGYPVFYATGTHWSRPAAITVMNHIADSIEKQQGIKLKDIQLPENMYAATTEDEQDQDLLNLLNIYQGHPDAYYYAGHALEQGELSDEYDFPRVFVQGGSFTNKLLEISRDNHLFADLQGEFYGISLQDYNRRTGLKTDTYEEEGFVQSIQAADIIILESNVENVGQLMPDLYKHIEQHLSAGPYQGQLTYEPIGLYGQELDGQGKTFRWGTHYGVYGFTATKQKGIHIQLHFPLGELKQAEGGELTEEFYLYCNGKKVKAFDYSKEDLEIELDIEQLGISPGDMVYLEFYAPYTFKPCDVMGVDDQRELGFQLFMEER